VLAELDNTGDKVSSKAVHGKVGVLIEDHFDRVEFVEFNKFFSAHGYQVVYMNHWWGQPSPHFRANPEDGKIGADVSATRDVSALSRGCSDSFGARHPPPSIYRCKDDMSCCRPEAGDSVL
jgi:hypothetical protein